MDTRIALTVNIPWGTIEGAVLEGASRAVRAAAFEAKAETEQGIRGPVAAHVRRQKIGGKWRKSVVTDLIDTGALLNSVYVIVGGENGENGRAVAIAAASAKQPGFDKGIPDPPPGTALHAQTNVAAGYGAFVEALYPFLAPAAERVKARMAQIAETEFKAVGLL